MASRKPFDRKFGEDFVSALPPSPAVYFIYDSAGELIYVGKAKNLRRRLGQYRNAKRRRKHHKMRAIVADAARIDYRLCADDRDATLTEASLIQEHRPRWNVAGAFYFLYPMVGMRRSGSTTSLCYTTRPEDFPGYEFHGAFRSRFLTGDAFFALIRLFGHVGHRAKGKGKAPGTYSYEFHFRQIPADWLELWRGFWMGESKTALETLVLALLENAAARRSGKQTQERLDALIRFYRHEALPLARVRKGLGIEVYPVPQRQRDLIFLENRFKTVPREGRSR